MVIKVVKGTKCMHDKVFPRLFKWTNTSDGWGKPPHYILEPWGNSNNFLNVELNNATKGKGSESCLVEIK